MDRLPTTFLAALLAAILVAAGSGCTSVRQYVHNGFKVGRNHQPPPGPTASGWIDEANPRVKSTPADLSAWWTNFNDPVLNDLVQTAAQQNVNLRVAASRVLEARAQRAIAVGQLFPQQQTAYGSYTRFQASKNLANSPPNPYFSDFAAGFNLSWEIDFWGKIRRSIESTDDLLQASMDDYDNVMVTLIGDVATAYVQRRTYEQQLVYTVQNVELQRGLLKIATAQWKAGQKGELPVAQSTSLVEQLEAVIPQLETGIRQTNNQLCVLLGIPPTELAAKLGKAPIPESPPEVIVGIPADLLRRRPDLRAAERQVAAQNAQIGVAEASFYPAFSINGVIGYEAKDINRLFDPKSVTGQVGPSFQWPILNYGRLLNNVRYQDYKTQELANIYQQKVLVAAQEVEGGIDRFLNARRATDKLADSVKAAERSVKLTTEQLNAGAIDFTPVFVASQFLAQQQNQYAQSQSEIALGLITTYRALGGGWEIRLADHQGDCAPTIVPVAETEVRAHFGQPQPAE